jgi:hypothetical protein
VGLFAPPAAFVLAVLFSALAVALRMGDQVDKIERGGIAFLWLGAGLAAAALAGGDAALELQLTLPAPFPATVARRLALALVWSAALSAAGAAYLVAAGKDLGVGEWNMQLTWLAPSAFLAGLGALGRAATRSAGAAAGLVGIVWIFFNTLPNAIGDLPWVKPWLLQYPVDLAHPDGWYANRAVLAGAACLATVAAFRLLVRPERLLGDEQ